MGGGRSASEEWLDVTYGQVRTSYRMKSRGEDASCVSERAGALRVRNVDRPLSG